MPYNIGQYKRTQKDSYLTPLEYKQQNVVNDETFIEFLDPAMILSGTNIVTSVYSYYLKFTVAQRLDSEQKFTITLFNSESETDNKQEVRTLTVKEGQDSTSFEIIFHPVATFDQIIFRLSRMAMDFLLDNGDNTSGRIMDVTIEDFAIVDNVVDTLASLYSGLDTLSKIGIQGPPGLMFCIDGEEIRIGRTGIYELYNDAIQISYIGFIIKDSLMTQDGKDFFTMDFKY